jgi:hypothetical protein
MAELEVLRPYLPLLIPLLIIQFALVAAALWDLLQRPPSAVRGPKWIWAIVIVFVNMIGPIVYFVVGRTDE